MGVYIKGMEIPTSCGKCKLFDTSHAIGLFSPLGWCRVNGKEIFRLSEKADFCPLVPVPPHGLIDRERILDSIRIELAQVNAVNDMEDYDSWMRVFDYVRKFPTVIPASEEG